MKTSETTREIYPAIIALQSQMETIKRDKKVSAGKYSFNYAPLDSIMETMKPLFKVNGLAIIQAVDSERLTSRLIHTSGEWIESETFLNKDHANMQGFGGEVTFKRRYALSALIGLVSDDDNDAPKARKSTSALAGIGDDLPEDWKTWLRDLADDASSLVNSGRVTEAIAKIDEAQLEDDQALYMWRHMDSKVRSTITAAKKPAL